MQYKFVHPSSPILLTLIIGTFLYICNVERRSDFDSEFLSRIKGPLKPSDDELLYYVRNNILRAPSKLDYNLELHKTTIEAKDYNFYRKGHISWNFLNKCLQTLYYNDSQMSKGFFIEVGAFDGEYGSNTLNLELELGWTGLLIEPDENLFRKLLSKNRKVFAANCCLSSTPHPYQTALLKLDDSANKEGNSKLFNSVYESRDFDARSKYGYATYDQIQCFPLQTLISALNRTHVHVISLDVEDVELNVLENFDWLKIHVDVWMVEHRHKNIRILENDKIDHEFIDFFDSKGYRLYKVSPSSPKDYVFIRRNSQFYQKNYRRIFNESELLINGRSALRRRSRDGRVTLSNTLT